MTDPDTLAELRAIRALLERTSPRVISGACAVAGRSVVGSGEKEE